MEPRRYYVNDLRKYYSFFVPKKARVLFLSLGDKIKRGKFDYIVLNNIVGDVSDVQGLTSRLKGSSRPDTRLIVTYYNYLWEPVLKFASFMGWRKKVKEQNWLDTGDIVNILNLSGFEVISTQKRFLFPLYIPFFSNFVNRWIAPLPLVNSFALSVCLVARPKLEKRGKFSVSIIVPARNESENIKNIVTEMPKFGKRQEIIFIEGHSYDDTWAQIKKEESRRKNVHAFRQKGRGKADAVRLGFKKAKGEILIIYDADRTVDAKDLVKFYNLLADGLGEFANGSRLVYPVEKEAMRFANQLGNAIFSYLFTWILKQRFKDTLCGTKAIFKKDYNKIASFRKSFGNIDPFGDFDLIFGAIKMNLKVVEVPVRYRRRTYGNTNIQRWKNGFELVKMVWMAYKKFNAF
ncbi:MAG TPA: glycosyltransferase family 2 protein [Patescibacteria group bacterium]|nr:glycosyltransferase family 2 protein [Patescibacteria group bacterium]